MSSTIIRIAARERNYTVLDNGFLTNTDLSWGAKGLLAYLLSKPDDWTVQRADLVRASTNGRDAVIGIIKELETAGHISRARRRTSGGKWAWETLVFEQPRHDGFTGRGEPGAVDRARSTGHGKPVHLVNTDGVSTESSAEGSAGLFGSDSNPGPKAPAKKAPKTKATKAPKPEKPKGNPAHQPALDLWANLWNEKHSAKYPITGRAVAALRDILDAMSVRDPLALPKVAAVFHAYLAETDAFVVKQKHPLHLLAQELHRWVNASPVAEKRAVFTADDDAFLDEIAAEIRASEAA